MIANLALTQAGDTLAEMAARFVDKAARRDLVVAVVGMGYVGLPLSEALVNAGFSILGFDLDPWKVEALNAGASYVTHFANARVQAMRASGRFEACTAVQATAAADAYVICVPTPVDEHRAPDLRCIEQAGQLLAEVIRHGQLVVLESTTYPGTTQEVLRPILEQSGLQAGRDFALAYSPEREDPGNAQHTTTSTPKVVGAETEPERAMAAALYGPVTTTVCVSDCKTAEAVKLSENIFRLVNISLINELKQTFAAMDIDVWEVVEAASTKPFGYMPFYPGPGVGGHCIPVDPFYLTWKARAAGDPLRLVELAGDIAEALPVRVVEGSARALSQRSRKAMKGARVLVLGVAYKRNIGDARETPALRIIEELHARGALVSYYDPHVPRLGGETTTLRSIRWSEVASAVWDLAIIVTDHDGVDYEQIVKATPLVIDTRNATAALQSVYGSKIVKL